MFTQNSTLSALLGLAPKKPESGLQLHLEFLQVPEGETLELHAESLYSEPVAKAIGSDGEEDKRDVATRLLGNEIAKTLVSAIPNLNSILGRSYALGDTKMLIDLYQEFAQVEAEFTALRTQYNNGRYWQALRFVCDNAQNAEAVKTFVVALCRRIDSLISELRNELVNSSADHKVPMTRKGYANFVAFLQIAHSYISDIATGLVKDKECYDVCGEDLALVCGNDNAVRRVVGNRALDVITSFESQLKLSERLSE